MQFKCFDGCLVPSIALSEFVEKGMSNLIEAQRSALEELETLEVAIANRFRSNFQLVPESLRQEQGDEVLKNSKKRTYKETMLQKHELKYFESKFDRLSQQFLANRAARSDLMLDEFNKIEDPKNNLQAFNAALEEIKTKHQVTDPNQPAEVLSKIYSMYSSAPAGEEKIKKKKVMVKRKHILSAAASHIDLDSIFSPNEFCGKFMDLTALWESYRAILPSDLSYVEYLLGFDQFDASLKFDPRYHPYLISLANYLEDFMMRVMPTIDHNAIKENIKKDFALADNVNTKKEDGSENEKGEVYCSTCDKLFTKRTVYDNHLSGKKHIKNSKLKKNDSEKSDISNDVGFLEFKIQVLAGHLKTSREATISNAERKYALTERERMIESLGIAGDESEYTTAAESASSGAEEESSDDEESYKDLPLGVDGKPIPFWLYKLQGLHQSYNCEICGNIKYKGRSLFLKHFSTLKHQQGLKFLGVTDDFIPLFKNIVNINEAIDLWQRLKKEKRSKEGEIENSVEVEDKDGNVMSEKDYIELKKQGLL